MTSRLQPLRASLASLRRARATVRRVTAWSAAATSAVLILAAVFALDFLFELAVTQRIVVLVLAAGAFAWAFRKFSWPHLGRREDEIELALVVERQQRIDSDLVAALQFDSARDAAWGSPRLATAVVDRVHEASPTIDVFAGLTRDPMLRRLAVLSGCLTVLVIVAALWPGHFAAFLHRLVLSTRHYPTRTQIEQIVVGRAVTLVRREHGVGPGESRAAEGQPLKFWVECSGRLPAGGAVRLAAVGGTRGRTRIELKALSLAERLAQLQLARSKLGDLAEDASGALSPLARDELLSLVRFDAPQVAERLGQATAGDELAAARGTLDRAIAQWPGSRRQRTLLVGELGRLNEDVTYTVTAGDARTEPALVHVIPLPVVEVKLTPTPPKYAAGRTESADPAARQLAVLEGSSVDVTAQCVNNKPLAAAWLTLQTAQGATRVELAPQDNQRLVFTLPAMSDALQQIRQEMRYAIEAVDTDGLAPESPIRGIIRIRPDQPPTGIASTVHKVLLPTAEPVIGYRASDDYGIARLVLLVEVERGTDASPRVLALPEETAARGQGTGDRGQGTGDRGPGTGDSSQRPVDGGQSPGAGSANGAQAALEVHHFDLFAQHEPAASEHLPLVGEYRLSLSPLKLAKGDRLKLALEVTDFRGENEHGQPAGITATSEPLTVVISDESGVLAAITQADQKSEQQLTDIIKRQLGIGEAR